MRHLITLLLLTGVAGQALAGASPAVAAPVAAPEASTGASPSLELSLDGVHWRRQITAPLFDPSLLWVPGDVRDETFFVRSTRPDAGALRVVVERASIDQLVDTGWLTLSARAGDGAWTSIESGGRHVLVDDDRVAGGQTVPVQVRATFDDGAPNGTMVLDSDLDFQVVLADASVVADAGDVAGDGDGNGNGDGSADGNADGNGNGNADGDWSGTILPGTGSGIRSWLSPLALLMVGSGVVILARRRREDQEAARG